MIRLAAKIGGDEVASIKSRLWVYDDPEFCAPYLVNDMISVEGEAVRVTFGSSGKPSGYSCSLNSTKPFLCKFEHPYACIFVHSIFQCNLHTTMAGIIIHDYLFSK